jgi:hypothetical protein
MELNPGRDMVWVEGTIQAVENAGSLLTLVVVDAEGALHVVTGDWRPVSLFLDDVISGSSALGTHPADLVVQLGACPPSMRKETKSVSFRIGPTAMPLYTD